MRPAAGYLALVLGLVVAAAALGAPPDRSPRPAPRDGGTPAASSAVPAQMAARVAVRASEQAPGRSLRPTARPGAAGLTPGAVFVSPVSPQAGARAVNAPPGTTRLAIARSLRPELRPAGLVQQVRATATRQTPGRVTQPGERGALCGVPGLVGERLEPILGRIQGCGIPEPVRLRAVEGIALSTPATVNCQTARALQTWVQRSLVPTVGRTGGGVASLRVVASYACRTRNNQSGGRISEHGRGNAIDIAGIGLSNGTELTVLTGWRERREGRMLRQLHGGACGPFGTVLGPNSDRFHQDHFHFDVASYRSGPYCR